MTLRQCTKEEKFADTPLDVLRRADTALKKAQEADQKYQKLMGF